MLKRFTKAAICIFICIFLLLLCSCRKLPGNIRIFGDFNECYVIEDQQYEHIVIYDSPEEDIYIKELAYEKFYGCEVKSNDFQFQFFAYQFYNNESAQEYFTTVTGKDVNLSTNYSLSSGMRLYSGVVIDDEKAYLLKCHKDHAVAATNFLNNIFTKEIYNW